MDQQVNLKNILKAIIISVLIILGIITLADSSIKNSNVKEVASIQISQAPQSEAKTYISDLIDALDQYHFASLGDELDENSSDILLDYMISLKNYNNRMLKGDRIILEYGDNKDELVSLTAQGVLAGSKKVVDANYKLYDVLKYQDSDNPNMYIIRDAMAEYTASLKEGYSLIALSAPQVGYLIFSPAKNEHPTGSIPYLISKNERQELVDQIDSKFGEYLYKTEANGDKNSIIFAVENIRKYLIADTYEEAETLQ